MTRTSTTAWVTLSLVAFWACSTTDPNHTEALPTPRPTLDAMPDTEANIEVQPDAGGVEPKPDASKPVAEAGPATDVVSVPDAQVEVVSCEQGLECMSAGGWAPGVQDECLSKVCPWARAKLQATLDCQAEDCAADCTDPGSSACTACRGENCGLFIYSCLAASCTEPELSCLDTWVCRVKHALEGTITADGCKALVCPAAEEAYDPVAQCILDECAEPCKESATGTVKACYECSVDACPAQLNECLEARCIEEP